MVNQILKFFNLSIMKNTVQDYEKNLDVFGLYYKDSDKCIDLFTQEIVLEKINLKTIFQRVQTTENLDYIRNLGIAVNDVSGDILPATTIIKKLADEFQNLDSATRKGLLIKIGGGFQIDKLAALLNDISSANGTFNRSLTQSTNAGNQGFQKLEELNKSKSMRQGKPSLRMNLLLFGLPAHPPF